MNFNPRQLPTYESLFPVLTNQTTSQYSLHDPDKAEVSIGNPQGKDPYSTPDNFF